MAAALPLSKAEYLKRYLSGADAGPEGGPESVRKRRRKRPKPGGAGGKGMRIVDDDVGWAAISTTKPEKEEEEDGDLPVVAEFVDERPEEVKQMEAFRSSAKWRLLGDHSEDGHFHHDDQDPSPPRRVHRDTPDPSSPRRAHHDTPDPSPRRTFSKNSKYGRDSDLSPRKWQAKAHVGAKKQLDPKGVCQKSSDSDLSPPRQKQNSGHQDSDSDLSPPRNRQRHRSADSDLSPPRRRQRTKSSDSDLSPPRRSPRPGKKFEFAETVFRDKSGRKRNLKLERLEQRRKAEKDSERDELYAQWGKGLAQSRQQQQNVEDAMKEMQKPLARYIDDEDLDRMLREQEREGDPMANFIKKNKAKENKQKKVRPRYSGPAPPPNRFNIWPGYRWDGVDRKNAWQPEEGAPGTGITAQCWDKSSQCS
ncbi:putative BUD13 isoform 1 [Cricetulus griseus]|uniref:BUD13 homolog n=1 Tax=Cricetulus griseus TaxID=10029 RepID=A0A061I7C4_CRIGR|nr:putative BUD13 isoform 1 [Cricetulus griseus]